MPTLNWIGGEAIVNHQLQVPFHLLKDVPALSCGDPGSGNFLVQGDNLIALKSAPETLQTDHMSSRRSAKSNWRTVDPHTIDAIDQKMITDELAPVVRQNGALHRSRSTVHQSPTRS
jgi:hypothetical protein